LLQLNCFDSEKGVNLTASVTIFLHSLIYFLHNLHILKTVSLCLHLLSHWKLYIHKLWLLLHCVTWRIHVFNQKYSWDIWQPSHRWKV